MIGIQLHFVGASGFDWHSAASDIRCSFDTWPSSPRCMTVTCTFRDADGDLVMVLARRSGCSSAMLRRDADNSGARMDAWTLGIMVTALAGLAPNPNHHSNLRARITCCRFNLLYYGSEGGATPGLKRHLGLYRADFFCVMT